jgi:hypothetical protein
LTELQDLEKRPQKNNLDPAQDTNPKMSSFASLTEIQAISKRTRRKKYKHDWRLQKNKSRLTEIQDLEKLIRLTEIKDTRSTRNSRNYVNNRTEVLKLRKLFFKDNKETMLAKQKFYKIFKSATSTEHDRYKSFNTAVAQFFKHKCLSCAKVCAGHSVTSLVIDTLSAPEKLLFYTHLPGINVNIHANLDICKTCHSHIFKRHQMPPLYEGNVLHIEHMPPHLKLRELENSCVAKSIIFLKMITLPKSQMSGVKDKVIYVPINNNDILQTMSTIMSLPRTPEEGMTTLVQLRRKVSYKNIVKSEHVRPLVMLEALRHFKASGHPGYQEITINPDFLNHWQAEEGAAAAEGEDDPDANACNSDVPPTTDLNQNQLNEADAITRNQN